MNLRKTVSVARAAELGWRRIDLRPWGKCSAHWLHSSGWHLKHCGHPTALHPWALYSPDGRLVLTGVVGPHKRADFGTAWDTAEEAMVWVACSREGYISEARNEPS